MSLKKTALALICLVGLVSCQPPPVDFDDDLPSYPEDDSLPQRTRQRTPGQQGVGPAVYDLDRQGALSSLFSGAVSLFMNFLSPLFSNMGVSMSNAILATMLRKRLSLIPEAKKYMAAAFSKGNLPSAVAKAL